MKLHQAYLLLTCFAATPVLAQTSALVAANNLNGGARPDSSTIQPTDRLVDPPADHPTDRQIARGPRTDDTRNCDIPRSGNGSSPDSRSDRVSPSAPASRTGYFGCGAAQPRTRN